MLDVFYNECNSHEYDRLLTPLAERSRFAEVRTLRDGSRCADVDAYSCVIWLAASRLPL